MSKPAKVALTAAAIVYLAVTDGFAEGVLDKSREPVKFQAVPFERDDGSLAEGKRCMQPFQSQTSGWQESPRVLHQEFDLSPLSTRLAKSGRASPESWLYSVSI